MFAERDTDHVPAVASLRDTFGRLRAAFAPPVAPPAKPAEVVGITGTANFYGDIVAEANTALLRQQAYGQSGQRTWGEWEALVRTDPDCATALDKTVAPLRDSRLGVKAAVADGLDEKTAARHAAFVEWCLTRSTPRWADFSQQLARGFLTYGFSLHEKVWGDVEHPSLPGGKGVGIVRFADRLPSSLAQHGPWRERVSESGEAVLDYIQQAGWRAGRWESDIRLPASKAFLVSWNRQGGNYAGYSVFRPVWYIAKQRSAILSLIGVAALREGAGVPVASANPTAPKLDEEQRKDLQNFLMSLSFHENAAAVLPLGWKLEWIYSPASNKTHLVDLYNALGVLILRTMSAQQVALGTGATGSRSVGEVHNAVANEFVQGVVSVIEGALADIAQELVVANFGPQVAYPLPAVTLKRSQLSAMEKAQAAKVAVDAGMLTPTLADENAMREDLGLAPMVATEADASGVLLNGAQVVAAQAIVQAVALGQLPRDSGMGMLDQFFGLTADQAAAVMASAGAGFVPTAASGAAPAAPPAEPPPSPPGNDAPEPKASPPVPMPPRAIASDRFVPRRELRASEKALDLEGMTKALDGAKDTFERGAKPIVAEMLAKALPAVKLALSDGDPSELATLALDSKRLDAFVGEYIAGLYDTGKAQVARELGGKATAADAPTLTNAMLEALRKQLVRRITSRISSDLEARAIDVVRTDGEPSEVISGALSDLTDSAALRTDSALVTTKAWSGGREDAARELGGVDEVELSAVLDSGTCGACEALDGTRYPFGSAEHDAHVPPLRECDGRDNCRCLLVYIPKGGA